MYYLNILYCNILSEDSCPASGLAHSRKRASLSHLTPHKWGLFSGLAAWLSSLVSYLIISYFPSLVSSEGGDNPPPGQALPGSRELMSAQENAIPGTYSNESNVAAKGKQP